MQMAKSAVSHQKTSMFLACDQTVRAVHAMAVVFCNVFACASTYVDKAGPGGEGGWNQ